MLTMWREPWFWRDQSITARLVSQALSPAGMLYNAVAQRRLRNGKPTDLLGCCVICVGNATVGGVGKTPFAIALSESLAEYGYPTFLTKGYGGQLKGPLLVDPDIHNAADVGDEALMFADHGAAWMAKDRAAGAAAAAQAGVKLLIADDGFQNPNLPKDVSILLIDENFQMPSRVFPAGPYREPLTTAIARADAVIFIRNAMKGGFSNQERSLTEGKLLGEACLDGDFDAENLPVIAFCGIGNPQRFRRSLEQHSYRVIEFIPFADHHRFSDTELDAVRQRARHHGATVITTEKDWYRIGKERSEGFHILPLRMKIDCPELREFCANAYRQKRALK